MDIKAIIQQFRAKQAKNAEQKLLNEANQRIKISSYKNRYGETNIALLVDSIAVITNITDSAYAIQRLNDIREEFVKTRLNNIR